MDGTAREISKSSVALNNLRGFVILIVLAFHSVLAYLGALPEALRPFGEPPYLWLAFPIIDRERWLGFDLFCGLQDVYLISFMFFLSGLFVWPSLARKGGSVFVYDRILRLGLPFAWVVLLVIPIAYYPAYLIRTAEPSFIAFLREWLALPFWPSGPPWFLWHLLVLNVIAFGVHVFAPRWGPSLGRLSASAGAHPIRYFVGLGVFSALAYVPLAMAFTPWEWWQFGPFAFQPSRPLHYALYFFAGAGIGAYGLERGLLAADGPLARRWAWWITAALAAFVLWIVPNALIVQQAGMAPLGLGDMAPFGLQVAANFAFVLCCAGSSFALAAVFLRFGARRLRGFDSLSENAYGMYLIHYLFVVWLQYAMLGVTLPAIGKAAIVFAGTLVLSWATIAAMRRAPLGARLVGADRRLLAKAP
jgi:glucans biosynthesis protein C